MSNITTNTKNSESLILLNVIDALRLKNEKIEIFEIDNGPTRSPSFKVRGPGQKNCTLMSYLFKNPHWNSPLRRINPKQQVNLLYMAPVYDFTISNFKNAIRKNTEDLIDIDKISKLLQCVHDEIDASDATFNDVINETIELLIATSNHFDKSFDEVISEIDSKLNNFSNNNIHQQITEQEQILNNHIDEFHDIIGNLKSQLK